MNIIIIYNLIYAKIKKISYSFVKNEINELNENNIITSNKILSLKNDYIDDFYSV